MLKECAVFFFVLKGKKNLSWYHNNHRCHITLHPLDFTSSVWLNVQIYDAYMAYTTSSRYKKICLSSPGLNNDIMNNDLSLARYIKHCNEKSSKKESTFPSFCVF